MEKNNDTVCVILAGGRGSRMASKTLHKVCFPIVDRPAIVRAIDTYKAAGVRRFLVVVGQMAEQVISTVAAIHPDVTFVFQPQPRGTGHAAMVAANALVAQKFTGNALIVMGDKVTTPDVVTRLMDKFEASDADMLLTTLPKDKHTTAGRIVEDKHGNVLGIIESADIKNARQKRGRVTVGGKSLTAAQVEKASPTVNASMYMFRFPVLAEALQALKSDNAQGELYLTDTAELIGADGDVVTWCVDNPDDLMAYNTPAELVAIEEIVLKRDGAPRVSAHGRRRLTKRQLKPAGEWLKIVQGDSPKWKSALRRIYGKDATLVNERRKVMAKLIRAFIKVHGKDRPMVLGRAPGRVNLMGRHVDHRGGFVNVMAISREVLLAAAPREDDLVTLRNLDPENFPDREFCIFDLLQEESWSEWLDFLASGAVRQVTQSARGDWSHYVRAPLLRLQHECRGLRLKGMDCMVAGNIPMGAGLSSSSALVVAFAEAAVAVNNLDVEMRDFIDLCGEGEWFVGSRGGSADHAAIRTSKTGYISRIGFFPFRLAGEVRLPDDLAVVIANSGAKAVKSVGARDTFNQRVACYQLAEILLKRHWPPAAGIEHLRDISPEHLKVRPGEIYRALANLPRPMNRAQLRKYFGKDDRDTLDRIFSTHADVGRYDLRGVALFGIAECLRSASYADTVARGDLEGIRQLMRTSHDGDRVVAVGAGGQIRRFDVSTDSAALLRLAETNADLALQPGHYACSTEAIDHMVDLADACDGVVGSQLSGAGLGGCMMVLVRTDSIDKLIREFTRDFYSPRRLEPAIYQCKPVAGAGLLGL